MLDANNLGLGRWLVVAGAVLLTACGARSSMDLEDYEWDSGAGGDAASDAPTDSPQDVIYDHVNDINGCNPSTCGGCCDENGECRTGMEQSACGIGGYQCVNCAAFNATCNAATHQCGAATECNAATCPSGCCDGNSCVPGTSNASCGRGGQACVSCPSNGYCDPGLQQCVGTGSCSPSNCSGCCDQWGNCNWGGDSWACGMGGVICSDCGMSGLICDMQTYTCTNPGSCGPDNCPGCCDSWGYCNWGGDDWACGWGGQYCNDCWSMGMSCDPYQQACVQQSECGPWNCNGCCDYYGNCNWGGDDWACGWGGQYCEDCGSMGTSCDPYQQVCLQQECGPWNCSGCCDYYGYCNWGGDDWACGINGQYCEDCSMYGGYCDQYAMACEIPSQCGPDNCAGCCDPYSNECRYGYDAWACGSGGQVCQDCTLPNMQCLASSTGGGMCLSTSPSCGPHNCAGCCDCSDPNGQCACVEGFLPYACGHDGQVCQQCMGSNQFCEPEGAGGTCTTSGQPEDCGPWNCAGCCTNSYPQQCVEGTQSWQCGNSGQLCQSCAPGQSCEWLPWGGGQCGGMYPDSGPPPPFDGGLVDAGAGCGPWNCAGCCTPSGQCRPGTSNGRCGTGGETCENCNAQNLQCVNGDCM